MSSSFGSKKILWVQLGMLFLIKGQICMRWKWDFCVLRAKLGGLCILLQHLERMVPGCNLIDLEQGQPSLYFHLSESNDLVYLNVSHIIDILWIKWTRIYFVTVSSEKFPKQGRSFVLEKSMLIVLSHRLYIKTNIRFICLCIFSSGNGLNYWLWLLSNPYRNSSVIVSITFLLLWENNQQKFKEGRIYLGSQFKVIQSSKVGK